MADGASAEVGAVAEAIEARPPAQARRPRRASVSSRFRTASSPGEETALVQFLNGGPAKPTFTPPRPFERGVGGAPTLVQNVETLAHLALIARFGPAWFRALGTPREPGTALVTLSGAVARPGVYEIALGTPLRDCRAGGRRARGVRAYPGRRLLRRLGRRGRGAGLRLSEADRPLGGALGAGAIVALPARACGLAETARVARYLADESAGQCGPCVHGLDAIADALERLAAGDRTDRRDGSSAGSRGPGRGACRHPDGAVAVRRERPRGLRRRDRAPPPPRPLQRGEPPVSEWR